ncbi:MAG: hypothetical protein AAGU74_05975 [Bacillota bacterium]
MSARRTAFFAGALAIVLCCAFFGGCVDTRPILLPDVTLPASAEPTEEPAASPAQETAAPEEPPASADPMDYGEYLLYQDIAVYEQEGYTLFDATIVSGYPGALVCVMDVCFSDKQGEVARGRLTDGSGQEVLYLYEGETRVYAQIETDMSVTILDMSFEPIGEPIMPLA